MEKDKAVSWLIRIFSIAILLGTIVWTITQTGVISLIGTEDVYWERARFLLGQGGATIYDGSSICSLGYSLILAPICALIKSPYAAYKAAVLLNGIFLMGAYLFATAAAEKLFPKERKSFLCAACFFAVFTPALMIDKTFTGPEMAVLLLMWIGIYLLASIWEEMRTWKAAGLAAIMILIGFLQVTALGAILAVTLLLGFYVRRKRVSETAFLGFVLAILLGIAAGNIAERVFLYAFAKDLDLTTISSSLEVLFNGITSFGETGWFTGLLTTMAGKLYSILIGTFLLACPAIWQLGKAMHSKKERAQESLPVLGITGIFVFQFLFVCLFDNSLGISEGMLSLSGLEMVLPPVILLGIVSIKNLRAWDRQLPAYLLLLCVCTFAAGSAMQAQKTAGVSASNVTNADNGFLMIFQGLHEASTPAVIYMAASVVMLITFVAAFLFLGNKKRLVGLQRTLGTAVALAAFFVINVCASSETVQALSEDEMENIAPVASLITGVQEESSCVYLSKNTGDQTIPVLQSLMPSTDLTVIGKDTEERQKFYREMQQNEPENLLILTDSTRKNVEDTYQKQFTGYRILYMTKTCTLWAPEESTLSAELESGVEQRTQTLALATADIVEADEEAEENAGAEEGEGNEDAAEAEISDEDGIPSDQSNEEAEPVQNPIFVYGGNEPLAGGTYSFSVELSDENPSAGTAKLTIADDSGILYEASLDEQIFDENGRSIFSAEFSTRYPVWKLEFSAEGSLLKEAEIKQVSYRKSSGTFMVGLDEIEEINTTAQTILYWDDTCGETGTVAYVDPLAETADEISTRVFESCLPDYEVQAVTEEGLADLQTDYLIADTSSRAFYPAMDAYSIISWDDRYTVLMRNDSAHMETFEAENGQTLSNGTQIYFYAFTGSDNPKAKISLDRGDYLYHVSLTYNVRDIKGSDTDTAGILLIKNGKSVLAEQEITYADLKSGAGELNLEIPLSLSAQRDKIKCSFENDTGKEIAVTPISVELASQNYQYGKEEPAISNLLALVNELEDGADLSIVLSEEDLKDQKTQDSWLEEQLPLCNVEEISADAALDKTEDSLLLTYGLDKDIVRLLSKYSILGHAGKYTLWAKNDGSDLAQLLAAGGTILNSGTKISLESIAAMSGKEGEDGVIAFLPGGSYTFYVKLTAKNLDPDDTIELTLYRNKKDSEIESELEELLGEGYSEEEAQEMIDPMAACGSTTFEAWEFSDSDNLIVKIKKSDSKSAKNLWCDAYTWKHGDVEAEIVWVEVN